MRLSPVRNDKLKRLINITGKALLELLQCALGDDRNKNMTIRTGFVDASAKTKIKLMPIDLIEDVTRAEGFGNTVKLKLRSFQTKKKIKND